MAVVWCDTETTGISPDDSGVFQVALLGVVMDGTSKTVHERMFMFNPLGGGILYHDSAGQIHGYTEEQVMGLPPEKEIVPNMVRFFHDLMTNWGREPAQKMDFCGYNPRFDWGHMEAALARCGYRMDDYFSGVLHDVQAQAKRAARHGAVPRFENLKLTTVAKSLGVGMDNAHDAMCDIKSTRKVSGILARKGVFFT